MLKMKKSFLKARLAKFRRCFPLREWATCHWWYASRGWATAWAVYQALDIRSIEVGLAKDGRCDPSFTPRGPVVLRFSDFAKLWLKEERTEWITQLWHIHVMQHGSVIKCHGHGTCMNESQKHDQWKKPCTNYVIPFMSCLSFWYF